VPSRSARRTTADDPPRRALRADTLYGLLFVFLMGGLAASLYSAYEWINPQATSICSVGSQLSCGKVLESSYSTTAGIPNWEFGVGGYLVMVAVAALAYRTFDRRYLTALAGLSVVGVLLSLYFVYLELGPIGSICLVCTSAHLLNVGVLVVTLALLRMSRPDADEAAHERHRGRPEAAAPD